MVADRAWVRIGAIFCPGSGRTIGSLELVSCRSGEAALSWATRPGEEGRGRTGARWPYGTMCGPGPVSKPSQSIVKNKVLQLTFPDRALEHAPRGLHVGQAVGVCGGTTRSKQSCVLAVWLSTKVLAVDRNPGREKLRWGLSLSGHVPSQSTTTFRLLCSRWRSSSLAIRCDGIISAAGALTACFLSSSPQTTIHHLCTLWWASATVTTPS